MQTLTGASVLPYEVSKAVAAEVFGNRMRTGCRRWGGGRDSDTGGVVQLRGEVGIERGPRGGVVFAKPYRCLGLSQRGCRQAPRVLQGCSDL